MFRDPFSKLNTSFSAKGKVSALKQLQDSYAQAMGIGFKKPKNQLLPDAQNANTKDEADFWAGIRKGLGLKDGEEIGQETVSGLRDAGFEAQDVMAHKPGMDDEDEPDNTNDENEPDPSEDDHIFAIPFSETSL